MEEQDFNLAENQMLTFLGEFHRMGNTENQVEISPYETDSTVILNYPSDFGYFPGFRLSSDIGGKNTKQYNKLSFRYGARLTTGGEGGISKTFYTFVAPNLENKNFKGAYSISVVDEIFMNFSKNFSLNGI